MKTFKLIFWLIGVVVMIAIGGIVVVTTLVDPNEYKSELSEQVKQKTGRDLEIIGDLDLTFYPWVGIQTGAMKLSNRPGFGEQSMFEMQEANIRVRLIPLFKKTIEIGDVILTKPVINLITAEDGTTNWGDLVGAGDDDSSEISSGNAGKIAGLAIQGVSLKDGRIIIDDRSAGEIMDLSNLNLNTGKVQPGVPLGLDFSMDIEASSVPGSIQLSGNTTIKVDEALQSLLVSDSDINLSLEGLEHKLKIPKIDLDLSTQELKIPDFQLEQAESTIFGELSATSILTAPAVTGELSVQIPDIQTTLQLNKISQENEEVLAGSFELSAGFSFLNQKIEVNRFLAEVTVNNQPTQIEIPFVSLDLTSESLEYSCVIFETKRSCCRKLCEWRKCSG